MTPDRLSFIDAVRWLLPAAPGEALPRLVVNPKRDRHEPRVKKDRGTHYPLMTKPRQELQRTLKNKGETVK